MFLPEGQASQPGVAPIAASTPEVSAADIALMQRILASAAMHPSMIPDAFMAYLVDFIQTSNIEISAGQIFGLNSGPVTEADLSFTDIATANSSTLKHGLLPKLSGSSSDALRGDGTFGAPAGGPPSGAAGGDLSGTYPNPAVAALAITDAKVAAANKDGAAGTASMRTLGTGATQATAGNDSRLSDSRAPNGAASGDLTGSYPGPTIAALAVTDAKVAAANKDGAAATPSMRTLGTGAAQAAAGNDARLSDARNAKGNGSSAQVANAVDTYITGSNIPITGVIKAGTVIRWRFTLTKSAAGLVAPIWNVRVGTAASTADTARLTFTSGTVQTAVIDTGWFELEVVVVSVSATGTITGAMRMAHKLATTGLQNVAQDQLFTATSGTFDDTAASLQIGVSVTPGTSGVFTFQTVSAILINPA